MYLKKMKELNNMMRNPFIMKTYKQMSMTKIESGPSDPKRF